MENLRLGDTLTFRIQGLPVEATVTSIRSRTRETLQPFFYFVLPETVTDATRRPFSLARANPLGALRAVAKLPGVKRVLTCFLILGIEDGYETNGLYYQRLTTGRSGELVRLLDRWDGRYEFLGAVGEVFYLLTTQSAPRGRIIAVSLAAPEPGNWREVVPESSAAIASAALIGGRLVLEYVQDAHAVLRLYKLEGKALAIGELPGQGSVTGFPGTPDDPETFLAYTDFSTPRTVLRLDTATGTLSPVAAGKPAVAADRFQITITRLDDRTEEDASITNPAPASLAALQASRRPRQF